MLSKKIFLSAAFVSMAGLVACGDDSSSNSNSKELPKSVPTFFDLADVECNADRKCETIIVENGPDTYECDGKQWNMLINSMPSKVCPAEEEKKSEEGAEEGGNSSEGAEEGSNSSEGAEEDNNTSEGSENTGDKGISSEAGSSDSGATSTDSEETSSSSAATAKVSCDNINEAGQQAFGTMGATCTEVDAGTMAATALELRCEDYDGTLGTGCPAESQTPENNGEVTGPTGDLYSCLQDSDMMGMTTKICTETTANSSTAAELKKTCTSFDYEGMKMTSTEGTGCSAETGYVKKCVVSNDAAVYFYDADAAGKSCEDLLKNNN